MNEVILCGRTDAGVEYTYGNDTKQPSRQSSTTVCGRRFDIGPGDFLRIDGGEGYLLCASGEVILDTRTAHGPRKVRLSTWEWRAVKLNDFLMEAA